MALLDIRNLSVSFATRSGPFKAVDGIDLSVDTNDVLAIVGESGSGKSTFARILAGLDHASQGEITWSSGISRVQMVFQDPYSSLNPRLRVQEIIGEALDAHGLAQDRRDARIKDLLDMVGINWANSQAHSTLSIKEAIPPSALRATTLGVPRIPAERDTMGWLGP